MDQPNLVYAVKTRTMMKDEISSDTDRRELTATPRR